MAEPAITPEPPYLVVVFTSQRSSVDDGYGETSEWMVALAAKQDGFLGVESARGPDGFGITVSYWRDEGSIQVWKRDVEHLEAQAKGRMQWYDSYALRVGTIERDSGKAWKT
ncbi:MAG: antibiotic biosynthesis monooxygenase [Euryarchaeota archaeon]|nr:antibiotic biosynthesis monooxygenase [Euryarchaeota archaeon]